MQVKVLFAYYDKHDLDKFVHMKVKYYFKTVKI